MRTQKRLALAFGLALAAAAASAQSTRVFVSVTGLDANDCSSPALACRTFARGVAAAATRAEVIVLRTGSYAGVTIDRDITISAPPGVIAFTAQPITVAVAGGNVILRGLTLRALTPGSGSGLVITNAARVTLQGCSFAGFQNAIDHQSGTLVVLDSTFSASAGRAIFVHPSDATTIVAVDRSRFDRNDSAVYVSSGVVSVANSVASTGTNGFVAISSTSAAVLTVDNSLVDSAFGDAILAGGSAAVTTAGRCTVTNSFTGLRSVGGGVLRSYQNNRLSGNTADTVGTITPVATQ